MGIKEDSKLVALVELYYKRPSFDPITRTVAAQLYPKMKNMEHALRVSVASKEAYPENAGRLVHSIHQRRLPRSVYPAAVEALTSVQAELNKATSFDELYRLVRKALSSIRGAGPLFYYDIALRVGEGFRKLSPERVYLQAGAAEGASALGFRGLESVDLEAFPKPLHQLTPAEVENFLCIYKSELGGKPRSAKGTIKSLC